MASRNKQRPNIVFILSDDQGVWANGCYGNEEIQTPNIDSLAENGIRFDQFFCASPVCSPARASILSGKIPSQHGVQDWIREGNLREGGIDYLDGITALTDVLAEHGYRCGISGKWHLGNSFVPQKHFSHWYVHQKGSGNYYNAPMVRDGEAVEEPGYITDLITDDAIACLRKYGEDDIPFYLSVHYTAPHNPWNEEQHPKEYLDLYRDCPFQTAVQEPWHPEATFRYSGEDARKSLIGYYASITAMDANIGRIIAALEELGLTQNTLVIFTSDNGYMCGQHGIWGKGNGTFSLNMYEYAVKVPAIMSHPGVITGGRVSDELFSHYDIMPTLLDYCGIDDFEDETLPGHSFAPYLRGESEQGGNAVMIFDEYGPTRMIRTKEWKYIHRYPHGFHELYDMVNDPMERRNLIDDPAQKKRIEHLRGQLTEWFLKYVDPRIDGAKEPVRGNGQLCRPGIFSAGQIAFDQNRKVNVDPIVDPGATEREKRQRTEKRQEAEQASHA